MAAAVVLIGGGLGAFFLVSDHSQTPTSVATAFLEDVHNGKYQSAASLVDPDDRPGDPTAQSLDKFPTMDQLATEGSGTYSVSNHTSTGTHAWVYVRATGGDVTGVVVCERVNGTWYVYFGTTSWAERSTTPNISATTTSSTTHSSTVTTNTTTTTVVTTTTTEEAAAKQIATLLAKDTAQRGAVNAASAAVAGCSGNIGQDSTTFETAASSRSTYLSDLSSITGTTTLPSGMMTDLKNAWQVSIEVDNDLHAWATAVETTCTSTTVTDNSSYQAATGPDQQATTDKKAFVALWNPVATKFNLPTYQWTQI